MMILDWSAITFNALKNIWQGFLLYLPKLFGAILVFAIGWVIAAAVGRLISEVLKKIGFNKIFEKVGWKEALGKAELKMDPAEFVGGVFKWIIIIVFLSASVVDILEFTQFQFFLNKIVEWLPNVIVSIAIFVVAIIVTDILEKFIKASVKKLGVGYVGLISTATKWAIYIFAFLAILDQLEVAPNIVNTFVSGFVGMTALAFGLAFGLGGKDAATKFIEDLRRKIS